MVKNSLTVLVSCRIVSESNTCSKEIICESCETSLSPFKYIWGHVHTMIYTIYSRFSDCLTCEKNNNFSYKLMSELGDICVIINEKKINDYYIK